MPDEDKVVQPEENQPTDNDGKRDADHPLTLDELVAQLAERDKRISQLNHEAAARRVEAEKERQKRLEEQGNFKALAEERLQKLAELESFQQRSEALEAVIRESNAERIQAIPDHMRGLVPKEYPPEKLAKWLDDNQQVFNRPTPPNLGAGVTGGNGSSIELSAIQKQVAEAMGMTHEAYAKRMKDLGLA